MKLKQKYADVYFAAKGFVNIFYKVLLTVLVIEAYIRTGGSESNAIALLVLFVLVMLLPNRIEITKK